MKKNDIIIKVLSLGVGLAVGTVLIAKVFFELSYDSFYTDIDRVYAIRTGFSQNGDSHDYDQVSGAVAVGFMEEVPGVEAGTRTTFVFNGNTYLDKEGNKLTATLVCADTCFFKVFGRPIVAGDPLRALGEFGSVMVSRSFAEKLASGHDVSDVLGKQIVNEDMAGLDLTINGVFEDFPDNGTLHYDILLSMETFGKSSTDNWLGNDRYKGYVRLHKGVDPHTLKDAIRKMQEAHQPLDELERNGTSLWYWLSPYDKVHTSDPQVRSQVILLSIVSALLILISLLNYILIVISSMVKRSREVGVRKCYGAVAGDIYSMLTGEAALHLLLALCLAAVMVFAGRSLVENLLGVPFQTLLVPQSIAAVAAVIILVLAVSIIVPAELYQRIPVHAALKNYTENSRNWKIGLLGVQVLINVFLVVMVLIIGRQYEKVSRSNPGYDSKGLYYINMYDGDAQAEARVMSALRAIPEVVGVEACNTLPLRGSSGDNVYLPGDDRQLFNIAEQYENTPGFYELMGIPFVDGRAPRDSTEVAVDEKFVRKMAEFADWSDGAVGKQVLITGHEAGGPSGTMGISSFTISGVYRNYLIGNLKDVDERPGARFFGQVGDSYSWMPHVVFRLQMPGQDGNAGRTAAQDGAAAALDKVRQALEQALDGRVVPVISYEDSVRAAYADSKKMRNTMALGAGFSLLVALLGLIGFIRDESLRRSKEMAVRKINGASTGDILGVFSWDVLRLAAVMAVIADVAAVIVARKWLEQFAERVSLNPLFFIAGALAVLAVVLVVVVLNCLKIARENPVVSLKNE